MADTKLLPCPFCGREPTSTGREGSPKCDKPYVHFVACYCGGYSASAHHIGGGLTPEEAERTAVAAWNRRAQPDLRAGWVCPETYMLTLEAVQTEAKRVAELSAEVEAKQRVAFQAQEMAREIASKLAAAEEEVERLRKEAERYRWLRGLDGSCDSAACVNFNIGFDWIEAHGVELDEAIDAAMQGANA